MRTFWRGPRLVAIVLTLASCATASATASATTTALSVTPASDASVLARNLQSHNATEAAAAAYWLGLKGREAIPQIPRLVATLGDHRPAQPAAYRHDVSARKHTTPGEEAAGALVRLGKPAVDPLIETLRKSTNSFARQNAAWALGQIDSAEREASAAQPRKDTHF